MIQKRIRVLNTVVDKITKAGLVWQLKEWSLNGKRKTVSYVNPHNINIACRDDEYANILSNMDLIYPDGIGVIWAARILNIPLLERTHIFDFFDDFAKKARESGIRFYLLGAKEEVVERAAKNLQECYGLQISGFHQGYFDNDQVVIDDINRSKPNLLMVGMGVPKQEKWIMKNLEKLDVNVCWAVGGSLNNFGQALNYAPRFIRALGLQWLFRLCQEPRRLWKRYIFGIPLFVYRILRARFNCMVTDKK